MGEAAVAGVAGGLRAMKGRALKEEDESAGVLSLPLQSSSMYSEEGEEDEDEEEDVGLGAGAGEPGVHPLSLMMQQVCRV